MPPKAKAKLRFKVGQYVLCKTGRIEWEAGEIVQLHWVDPWEGEVHPYQVRMWNDNRLIYVPFDDEQCCKALDRAWWEDVMDRTDLSDEQGVLELQKHCKGQDPDAKNHQEGTALVTAMEYQWKAGAKALLELKADPNCGGKHSCRPLHLAVYMGRDMVEFLLEARADPNLQDKDPDKDPDYDSKSFEEREWHRTALHYAAAGRGGDTSVLSILLEGRADPNALDAQSKMPLHLAIESKAMEGVELLCKAKADLNAGNYSIGMTTSPLIDAAYRDDLKVMDLLIAARADLDQKGKQGMTALHVAARGRHPDAVKKLVEARADATITAMGGKTAGELAARNGMAEIASLLGHAPDAKENVPSPTDKNSKISQLDEKTRAMLFMD